MWTRSTGNRKEKTMKAKVLVLGLCGVMLVSSCGTTGSGAIAGGYFGGAFGSAIGGLIGGYRGHEMGTVIGMATGAVAGAVVEKSEQDRREREMKAYRDRVAERQSHWQNESQQYDGMQHDDSGFDGTNSGDDRLYDFGSSDSRPTTIVPSNPTNTAPHYGNPGAAVGSNAIELRNVHFVGNPSRNILSRSNPGKIVFELRNVSGRTIYDIIPSVVETTGNKRIVVSPSVRIESILPGQTLRYTAMVKPIRTLRNGAAEFELSVVHGNRTISRVVTVGVKTEK